MGVVQQVSPFRCRTWELHDRLGEEINATTCTALIQSLQKHGQKQPALGRRLPPGSEYEIELIYGARRLFATRHLGIPLLVDIRDIDDRDALVEMDIENRVRTDISPYERGLSYKRWLREGFFSSQVEVARSLGVSESQISRLLKYADLPSVVIQAFRSPREIREEWAVALAKRCKDAGARDAIVRRARSLSASPRQLSSPQLYDFIVKGAGSPVLQKNRDEVVKSLGGSPIMRVAFRSKTIHLILPRERIDSSMLNEIKDRMRDVLDEHAVVDKGEDAPNSSRAANGKNRIANGSAVPSPSSPADG